MIEKFKVVHITETFVTGVYSYIRDLSEKLELEKDIHNIVIYSDERKGRLLEEFPPATELVELGMVREINFTRDKKSFFALKKLLTDIKPDVIHVHSSKAGFLGRLAVVFMKKKPKVFYTAHGFSFLRTDIPSIKRKFYFGLEKFVAKLSNSTIVACGDTELEYASKLNKSVLVRNGVNIKKVLRYYQEQSALNSLTIGIIGRISFPRNPSLFNRIAQEFNDIKFLWIGGGELESEITAPNIEVTGWFNNKADGYSHLNDVDIYLQTSLWEGLPIAVLEAMAFKKPIVASNVIGNKDAVVNNETGYLFDDFEQACDSIQKLIDSPMLRNQMGKRGFERCQKLFDTNNNFDQLIKLYKNE